jgi:hypothetical protein
MITRQRAATKDFSVSVFLRLGWFFKDQWRRYLVAISLLMLVALFTVIPSKVAEVAKASSKRRFMVGVAPGRSVSTIGEFRQGRGCRRRCARLSTV